MKLNIGGRMLKNKLTFAFVLLFLLSLSPL